MIEDHFASPLVAPCTGWVQVTVLIVWTLNKPERTSGVGTCLVGVDGEVVQVAGNSVLCCWTHWVPCGASWLPGLDGQGSEGVSLFSLREAAVVITQQFICLLLLSVFDYRVCQFLRLGHLWMFICSVYLQFVLPVPLFGERCNCSVLITQIVLSSLSVYKRCRCCQRKMLPVWSLPICSYYVQFRRVASVCWYICVGLVYQNTNLWFASKKYWNLEEVAFLVKILRVCFLSVYEFVLEQKVQVYSRVVEIQPGILNLVAACKYNFQCLCRFLSRLGFWGLRSIYIGQSLSGWKCARIFTRYIHYVVISGNCV